MLRINRRTLSFTLMKPHVHNLGTYIWQNQSFNPKDLENLTMISMTESCCRLTRFRTKLLLFGN